MSRCMHGIVGRSFQKHARDTAGRTVQRVNINAAKFGGNMPVVGRRCCVTRLKLEVNAPVHARVGARARGFIRFA